MCCICTIKSMYWTTTYRMLMPCIYATYKIRFTTIHHTHIYIYSIVFDAKPFSIFCLLFLYHFIRAFFPSLNPCKCENFTTNDMMCWQMQFNLIIIYYILCTFAYCETMKMCWMHFERAQKTKTKKTTQRKSR